MKLSTRDTIFYLAVIAAAIFFSGWAYDNYLTDYAMRFEQ